MHAFLWGHALMRCSSMLTQNNYVTRPSSCPDLPRPRARSSWDNKDSSPSPVAASVVAVVALPVAVAAVASGEATVEGSADAADSVVVTAEGSAAAVEVTAEVSVAASVDVASDH